MSLRGRVAIGKSVQREDGEGGDCEGGDGEGGDGEGEDGEGGEIERGKDEREGGRGGEVRREDEEREEEKKVRIRMGCLTVQRCSRYKKTVENITETRVRGKCVKYNTTRL